MGKKLDMGNLAFDGTDKDLEEAFAPVGACEAIAVVADRTTAQSRERGDVEMPWSADGQTGIQCGLEVMARGPKRRVHRREGPQGPASRERRQGVLATNPRAFRMRSGRPSITASTAAGAKTAAGRGGRDSLQRNRDGSFRAGRT